MSKNVGVIRLLEPDQKTIRKGSVLLLKQEGKYMLCPLWRSAPNKLVSIMTDAEGKLYIDASDPFAYELPTAPTLAARIDEFNTFYSEKEIDIKIVSLMTEDDLKRANIPCFAEEDELEQSFIDKIPVIRMFV